MGGGKSGEMKAQPAKPKAELIVFRSAFSPNLSVRDPETGEVKRSTDIPSVRNWSANDPENYFDGQNLWLVAFSPDNRDPEFVGSEVILVNLDTLAVTNRIPLGKEGTAMGPTGISNGLLNIGRGSPEGQVFIGKMRAGEVVMIDAKTQAVVLQKRVGDEADFARDTDFGTASDGVGRLYVATGQGGKVLALDPKSLAIQSTYRAPEGVLPINLTVAPRGDRVWVQQAFAANFAGQRKSVMILDAKTLDVIGAMDTGKTALCAGFSPDTRLAYVTHSDAGFVSVFDTSTLMEVRRLEVPMAMGAPVLAVHPDGGSIYTGVSDGTDLWYVRVETATWAMSDPIGRRPATPGSSGFFMRRLG